MSAQDSLPVNHLLSVKEAAEYLRLAVPTIYKMCCQRTGPRFIKCGTRTLFRIADLEAFLAEHTVEPVSDDSFARPRRGQPRKAPARVGGAA